MTSKAQIRCQQMYMLQEHLIFFQMLEERRIVDKEGFSPFFQLCLTLLSLPIIVLNLPVLQSLL